MYTNYAKGRKKEYKICKELRDQGFDIVQRSAGSHSPIDIFAIRKKDNKILLVQVKPDDISALGEIKIIDENFWLNNEFKVRFKVR